MRELAARRSLIVFDEGLGYASTSDRWREVERLYKPDLPEAFQGEWLYAMLTVVHPNGTLPPHSDGALPSGIHRFHIVLQTNLDAWCLHDGKWEQLEEGYVYELDATKRHGAINWGAEDRVHLVMDIKDDN